MVSRATDRVPKSARVDVAGLARNSGTYFRVGTDRNLSSMKKAKNIACKKRIMACVGHIVVAARPPDTGNL
ncbi:hypothetical protein D9M72_630290 [compost metagenome]